MFSSSKLVLTGNTKVLTIGLIGVGAYTVMPLASDALMFLRGLAPAAATGTASGAGKVESAEALLRRVDDKLDRAVDRLSRASQGGGEKTVHVVTAEVPVRGGMATTVLLVGVVVAGGAALVLWRGKYVTKAHLSSAVHVVTDGLKAVHRTVEALKGNMHDAFLALTGRVEHGIEKQEEIADVVDELQQDIKDVHEVVKGCEQYLLESSRKQDVTMRGVQLLCGVVAESLASGTTSKKRLEQFVRGTSHLLPPTSSRDHRRSQQHHHHHHNRRNNNLPALPHYDSGGGGNGGNSSSKESVGSSDGRSHSRRSSSKRHGRRATGESSGSRRAVEKALAVLAATRDEQCGSGRGGAVGCSTEQESRHGQMGDTAEALRAAWKDAPSPVPSSSPSSVDLTARGIDPCAHDIEMVTEALTRETRHNRLRAFPEAARRAGEGRDGGKREEDLSDFDDAQQEENESLSSLTDHGHRSLDRPSSTSRSSSRHRPSAQAAMTIQAVLSAPASVDGKLVDQFGQYPWEGDLSSSSCHSREAPGRRDSPIDIAFLGGAPPTANDQTNAGAGTDEDDDSTLSEVAPPPRRIVPVAAM